MQKIPEVAQAHLAICQAQAEELEWVVSEMLESAATEEKRFLREVDQELEPVRTRLKAKEGTAKELEAGAAASPVVGAPAATPKAKILS